MEVVFHNVISMGELWSKIIPKLTLSTNTQWQKELWRPWYICRLVPDALVNYFRNRRRLDTSVKIRPYTVINVQMQHCGPNNVSYKARLWCGRFAAAWKKCLYTCHAIAWCFQQKAKSTHQRFQCSTEANDLSTKVDTHMSFAYSALFLDPS